VIVYVADVALSLIRPMDSGFLKTFSANPQVNRTRVFLNENSKELLIGITTLLLSSLALLYSKITHDRKQIHDHSVSVAITLLFELAKLFISLLLFGLDSRNRIFSSFMVSFKESSMFAIPAIIYLINDNLLFTILSIIEEPTTFEILANMRILATAILFRIVFHRTLHKVQWAALLLLAIGSATSQLVTCGDYLISNVPASGFFLTLLYSVLSACGGIYTEHLMKKKSTDSFYLQNVHLHAWGTGINAVILFVFYSHKVHEEGFFEIAIGKDYIIVLVVLNHALAGLAISAIIKYTDNIAKVYAHCMGMLLTMVISSAVYWQVPSIQMLFGMSIVIISLYLFYTEQRAFPTFEEKEIEHHKDDDKL